MAMYVYVDSERGFHLRSGGVHVDSEDWASVRALLDVLVPSLSPGKHSLVSVAEVIVNERPSSVVASASADELRLIARKYQAPVPSVPLYVEHQLRQEGTAYVCGDVHGQYDLLMAELARVGFDFQKDTLFCTGDLIDRGSDSLACLSLVFEPWLFCCLGNHERMAWDALSEGAGPLWNHWVDQGGNWVYMHYAPEVKSLLGEALRHMPLAREVVCGDRRIGICHAEPPLDWQEVRERPEYHLDRLTWGRTRIKRQQASTVKGVDAVVVGHSIVPEPTWLGNVVFLDTGAYHHEGRLTLVPLADLTPSV